MGHLLGRRHALQLGVLDDEVVGEVVVDGDVDVLVDGRCDEEAAVAFVERRQVRAAAAEGDAQRAAGDYHRARSPYSRSATRNTAAASARFPALAGSRSNAAVKAASSAAQEPSSSAYSYTVTSGGPISGSMRYQVSRSGP